MTPDEPDMVNPMQDMGLIQDKQALIEPQGFLIPCNAARLLCERYIPDGGRLYDLIDRYDNIASYVLNRDNTAHNADVMRMVAPFLRAFGATDLAVRRFYDSYLPAARGAAETADHLISVMPTYVNTCMYEHAAYAMCEKLDIPLGQVSSTSLDLDGAPMTARGAAVVREMAKDICDIELPAMKYEFGVPLELGADEVAMISRMDEIFLHRFPVTPAEDMVRSMDSVDSNQKAYALIDIRKTSRVDLDGTVYIGGEAIDYQVMDLVRDGNGLSLSFNGTEFAVRGANVAAITEDCTVAAVLAAEFYDTGIQGVFDLVEHWDRKHLEGDNIPDRPLVDAMLRNHPKKLPTVVRVTRDNAAEVAEKSDVYRRRMLARHAWKNMQR